MTLRIGSLCSGVGMIELAVESVFPDAELAWYAQYEPPDKDGKIDRNQYAARIMAHHWPGVPNHGDITAIDYAGVEPVDILTAGFPCFPAGTLILTSDGYKPIEVITAGDRVLTHLGRWRPVTRTMARDGAELWRVKAGHPITTTAEHPFYATAQHYQWDNSRRQDVRVVSGPEWTDAAQLVPWRHRIGHTLPPVRQSRSEDPDWWWLVGRYLADGHRVRRLKTGAGNPVKGDQGRVVIAAGPGKDEEIRKRLFALGLHATEVRERSVIKFHIIHQGLYAFLADFGHGAASKALTAEALSLPADLAEELLAGWLAGDGYKAKSGWVGNTISKALALGIVVVAHRARGVLAAVSYSVPAPTVVIEGRTVNQRPMWRIAIPEKNRRGIVDGDYAWRFVTDSAALGEVGRVFNLSVEEDESYIADNAIVHNCTDLSLAGKRAGLMPGTRSGVWSHVARAIGALRPSLVLIENVRSLTSARAHCDLECCPRCMGAAGGGADAVPHLRALGCVLGDLADLGFDAEWTCLPASTVGAPHKRERVFVLAWPAGVSPRAGWWASAEDAHQPARGERRLAAPGQAQGGRPRADARGRGGASASDPEGERHGHAGTAGVGGPPTASLAGAAADPAHIGHERDRDAWDGWPGPAHGGVAASDAQGVGRGEGRPEPARLVGGPDAAERRSSPVADSTSAGREGARPEPEGRGSEPGGEPAADSHGDAIREQPVALARSGSAPLTGSAGTDACPTCGCGQCAHDAGGFCAVCGTCTDPELGRPAQTPADSDGSGRAAGEPDDAQGQPDTRRRTAADPDEGTLGAQRDGEQEGPEADHGRHRPDASGRFLGWGPYTAAIERWEHVLGRPAPSPVDDRGRLNPPLPEWMMGLPDGWVTGVPGIPRNAQLHGLGNGCVVQQAAHALRLLLPAYLAAVGSPGTVVAA